MSSPSNTAITSTGSPSKIYLMDARAFRQQRSQYASVGPYNSALTVGAEPTSSFVRDSRSLPSTKSRCGYPQNGRTCLVNAVSRAYR